MKRVILLLAVICMGISANAQSKFEVKNFDSFKLHSYVTADPLGNMSYIIEGENGLVVLEPVVFHENIKEFGVYVAKLKKPIEKIIASYHAAGFNAFDSKSIVMIKGMDKFEKSEAYTGMLAYFASTFGDALDSRGHEPTATVANDAKVKWAGIDFKFSPGASTDFPASSVLIGKKVYYTHFTPVANMHMGALQITGREAVEAYLSELEYAKSSEAIIFIGGHGMGTADMSAVDFQIAYLKKVNEVLVQQTTADGFTTAMKAAYPEITGETDLAAVAAVLYP